MFERRQVKNNRERERKKDLNSLLGFLYGIDNKYRLFTRELKPYVKRKRKKRNTRNQNNNNNQVLAIKCRYIKRKKKKMYEKTRNAKRSNDKLNVYLKDKL